MYVYFIHILFFIVCVVVVVVVIVIVVVSVYWKLVTLKQIPCMCKHLAIKLFLTSDLFIIINK